MKKAQLFANGRSQAVRLPKEFRFPGTSVNIRRLGRAVILFPDDDPWSTLFEAFESFPDDFMADGRQQPPQQVREDPFA